MLRRAANSILSAGARGLRPGALLDSHVSRAVANSAVVEQAAAAATPAVKAPNMQEFSIYRWNPETGAKPTMQSYKVQRSPTKQQGEI